jgi:hypothetical protein
MKKIFHRLFRFFVDGYFLYASDVNSVEDEPSIPLPEGYSTRVLDKTSESDINQLYQIWGEAYFTSPDLHSPVIKSEVDALLEGDDVCVLLLYGEEVAGMQWAGFSDAFRRIDFARCLLKDINSAVFHHSYISPKHRGKKLQIPMMWYALQVLKSKGVQNLYTFVGVRNFASVKNMMKSYQRYQIVYHIKTDIPLLELNLFPGFDPGKWHDCVVD